MLSAQLNIACWVTVSRIVLLPVVLLSVFLQWPHGLLIAAAACAIAGFSDSLDGYLARRNNCSTSYGAFLDLVADKLFVSAVLILLASMDIVPFWVPGVIIVREIGVTILRQRRAAGRKRLNPDRWGKAKTVVTMIAITGLFLRQGFNQEGLIASASSLWPLLWVLDMAWWVMLGAVVLTVFSGANYFAGYYGLQVRRNR